MTDREIIKWAKQNLQEVQKLKEKTDQAKQIQECGMMKKYSNVNQVVTKKLRKNCKKIWWIGKVVVTLQSV